MIEKFVGAIQKKIHEINERHKVTINLPVKLMMKTGADIDGDQVYIDGCQYFTYFNKIYDVGIVDAISIKCRAIFGRLKVAYRWIY